MKQDDKKIQIRNSTVDFLVFTKDAHEEGIEVRVQNGTVWLTQKAISELFDIDRSVVNKHLKNIYESGELDENSTYAKFAQVADNGKTYQYKFYSLPATLTFYDRISKDMREAFEGLTEFCDRINEAERFDEPHLLPIALDIFGNEKLDLTSEYVAMRKTSKSKTMITARRMYFDDYYSFVLTDFFEGLHYGHYPRRCPICKRYFLMTSARRQVYCNGTSPYTLKGKPITCRKYAARIKEKELSEGNPINPIYKSRCSAIRVEQKRSTITAEFTAMALKIAKEYWQKAKFDDSYANGQYKMDMKRENLYMETDRRVKQK